MHLSVRLSVRLSVYVGLTIFKVNKLLTLIAGFAPSMFYILLVIKNFFSRFDQVFMLVLEQLQPLCVSEEKFCTTFFHFPRAEETRGVSEGGRKGGRKGGSEEGREGREGACIKWEITVTK